VNKILESLITLNDLDLMIEEIKNPNYRDLGFEIDVKQKLDALERARDEIRSKIPENILRKYDILKKRYGRGVSPIIGGVCMNCFVKLPISVVSQPHDNNKIETCPNCGIFIYWA